MHPWLIVLAGAAFVFALFQAAVVADVLSQPRAAWDRAARKQGVWLGVVVLAGPLGVLAYGLVVRPKLLEAAGDGTPPLS